MAKIQLVKPDIFKKEAQTWPNILGVVEKTFLASSSAKKVLLTAENTMDNWSSLGHMQIQRTTNIPTCLRARDPRAGSPAPRRV